MNLIDLLSGPVAEALGWTLLHALWQGFALVMPAAVLLHLLRNKSSNLRYRVSAFTLLTQVVVSLATYVWYYQPVSALTRPTLMESLPVNWQTIGRSLSHQPLPWHQQMQQFLEIHLSQFVLVYLIGVALFGIRLAGGWIYLQRLSRTATPPSTPAWTKLANTLRSALAVRAVVQVRESARITVPMVVGVLKPVLLMPIGLATSLSMREVEAVLAHELAHIKRHDYAVNLLQSVVEVLYFFHPALWWLSARVREEREHCCDDLAVIAIGGNGRMLAQALARVEEVRLVHTAQTPALAMAFASKRQHLLHRVQRMLGVPTRPFVSNNSLAGLTLATLLLVSVSVYAVQQQDEPQPKPRKAQSKATRRHKVDRNTEFGFTDNRKLDFVIWKGKKLPAAHLARIQRQYDQVMGGKLSLDTVKQPDRDILLTIIETNNSLEKGMDTLAEGLGKIDYDNIYITDSIMTPTGWKQVLDKINYTSDPGGAPTIARSGQPQSDSLDKQQAYHQRQVDSLSKLTTQHAQQMQSIRLQMEKFRFPIEEIGRNNDVLQWRKEKLMEQRDALVEKHQRLLHNDGKQKLTQAEVEKQLAALEPEIKKLESNMEALNKQFEEVNTKQEVVRQPLEKLEREAEGLDEQIDRLSREIEKHSEGLAGNAYINHELNMNLNRELHMNMNREINRLNRQSNRQLRELNMNLDHQDGRISPPARPAIPARPARPPRPAIAPNAARPATPTVPDESMIEYEYDLRAVRPTRVRAPRIPHPPRPAKAPNNVVVPATPPAPSAPGPAKVDDNQSGFKGRFQKLGQFVDSDSTIKSATFRFKRVDGQKINVDSLTFVKTDDAVKQKSPGFPTVKIIGAPKK
jgi:bla regulator protein BlaR1